MGSLDDRNIGYLVLGSPRTGTNLLCHALRATGQAGDPDEWYGVSRLDDTLRKLGLAHPDSSPQEPRATDWPAFRRELSQRAGHNVLGNDFQGARSAAWLSHTDDPSPAPGVLYAPSRVPIQTWSKGRSICFRYDPRSVKPKDSEPTRRLLARLGLDPREIAEGLDAELESAVRGCAGSSADGAVDLELLIGYALLHELWVTAMALGALLPSVPGFSASPRAVLGPAARRALRTMAPGALRCFVSAADLSRCEDALAELVINGVRRGLAFRDRS